MKTKMLMILLLAGTSLFARTHVSIGIGLGGYYPYGYYYAPPPVYYAPPPGAVYVQPAAPVYQVGHHRLRQLLAPALLPCGRVHQFQVVESLVPHHQPVAPEER